MKSKVLIFVWTALFAAVLLLASGASALAQEGEPVVIDSVVAQVNGDVIMLSVLKNEIKDAIEAFKQQGMTDQKASEEVTRHQPELIANLVNELLLVQKGKELNLTEEVEADVNREMLRVMQQQGFKTMQEMEEAMRKEGIDPASIRNTLRTQYMKNAVLSNEVDRKIYDSITSTEAKAYYEKNRDKFRKPEVVSLSEIFLSLAGRPEADVRAKANQILAQLRSGADFGTLAAANSERLDQNGNRIAVQNKGKVGTFILPDLKPEFVAAIKNVPVGGVTDLIRSDEGFQILRVDERTPGGDASAYEENKVREAITIERREKAREEYMKGLRKEAYIRVADEYKATVMPLLAGAPSNTATTSPTPEKSGNKKP